MENLVPHMLTISHNFFYKLSHDYLILWKIKLKGETYGDNIKDYSYLQIFNIKSYFGDFIFNLKFYSINFFYYII